MERVSLFSKSYDCEYTVERRRPAPAALDLGDLFEGLLALLQIARFIGL